MNKLMPNNAFWKCPATNDLAPDQVDLMSTQYRKARSVFMNPCNQMLWHRFTRCVNVYKEPLNLLAVKDLLKLRQFDSHKLADLINDGRINVSSACNHLG